MVNAKAERFNTINDVFRLRDDSTKIVENQNLPTSQKLLLGIVNNLVAAYMVDRGVGFVAGIAQVVVPFVNHHYNGKLGDVIIGNIVPGRDSLDPDSVTFCSVVK